MGDRIVLRKDEDELPTLRTGRGVGEREIEEAMARGLVKGLNSNVVA